MQPGCRHRGNRRRGHLRRAARFDPQGERAAGAAIYYLLAEGQRSAWHRVDADEAWHYYAALIGGLDPGGPAWWTGQLVLTWESLALLLLAAVVTWGGHSPSRFIAGASRAKWVLLTILFWICLIAMGAQSGNPFLYYFF